MKHNTFFLLLIVFIFTFTTSAQAFQVTVKRVIFEGKKRAEAITIINNEDKPITFRLGWVNLVMTPENGLQDIAKRPDLTQFLKPSDKMVKFAPRRFTLAPKSAQVVRMVLRTPANLPDGEYRSHLSITPEADVEELKAIAKRRADSGDTGGATIQMLTGVTMPIIVRKGNLGVTSQIEGLSARDSQGFVEVLYSLVRGGDKSLYGTLNYVCNPGSNSEYSLRATKGVGVYAEIDRRNFNLRIQKKPSQPRCATLAVRYAELSGFQGKELRVIAEANVNVSN